MQTDGQWNALVNAILEVAKAVNELNLRIGSSSSHLGQTLADLGGIRRQLECGLVVTHAEDSGRYEEHREAEALGTILRHAATAACIAHELQGEYEDSFAEDDDRVDPTVAEYIRTHAREAGK